MAISGLGDGGP